MENGNTLGLGQEYGPRLLLKFDVELKHMAELRHRLEFGLEI